MHLIGGRIDPLPLQARVNLLLLRGRPPDPLDLTVPDNDLPVGLLERRDLLEPIAVPTRKPHLSFRSGADVGIGLCLDLDAQGFHLGIQAMRGSPRCRFPMATRPSFRTRGLGIGLPSWSIPPRLGGKIAARGPLLRPRPGRCGRGREPLVLPVADDRRRPSSRIPYKCLRSTSAGLGVAVEPWCRPGKARGFGQRLAEHPPALQHARLDFVRSASASFVNAYVLAKRPGTAAESRDRGLGKSDNRSPAVQPPVPGASPNRR